MVGNERRNVFLAGFLPVGGHVVAGSRREIISPWNDNETGLGAI